MSEFCRRTDKTVAFMHSISLIKVGCLSQKSEMAYFKKHLFLCVTTVKQQNKKQGNIQNAQKRAPLLYIEDNIFILVYNIF